MEVRQFLQDCILVIFLVNIHFGISFGIEDDYEDGPSSFNRCPWIRNKLKNGRVKYRYRGRVAKFVCDAGYELAGKRSATCVAGQWSNPLPVCVARGCSRMPSIANGRVTVMYRGALLGYDCNPGYALEGASSIHCDGRRWNTDPPTCNVATETPDLFCDFESPDLCGWAHDPNHDFDWKRNQFSTPSGHAATGPSFDHSFGENKGGYYLYIEASTPRKLNDTARIFSPVYFPSMSGGCFLFWYHMFGATTGGLKVYLKPESHVLDELTPTWGKFGDQGNKWMRGNIDIPILQENFQIVIEGIRGESYVGDSAIDDVTLTPNDCLSMENDTGTTEKTIADSCRGRCREPDSGSSCGCNDNCNAAQNCCTDYITLCYEVPGNDTTGVNPEEPGDFYAKTTIPATVTATFVTENVAEDKSSSVSSDATSLFSTEQSVSTTIATSPETSSIISSTMAVTQLPIKFTSSTESPTSVLSTSGTSSTSATAFSTTSTVPFKETSTTSKAIPISTTTVTSSQGTKEISSTLSTSTASVITSTTPIPTTVSSTTTMKSTTTISSSSSTTQTAPVSSASTPRTSKLSSTTVISPGILITTSPQTDKISSVVTASSTLLSTTTESPTTSTYPDVTTLSSTRKTYNLRPRPSSTTSLSSSSKSSAATSSTFTSTQRIYSTTPTTTTPFASSTPYSTSWHNFPVSTLSTISSTRSTLKQTTAVPTTKTTTSTTTRKYTTISSQTTNRQAQKFTFIVTATSFPFKDRVNQQDTSKSQTSASNSTVPIVISVIAIVLLSITGGVVYYVRKQKNKRQSKLSDDSEMRFLEENEHMEYSDASALDKILIK